MREVLERDEHSHCDEEVIKGNDLEEEGSSQTQDEREPKSEEVTQQEADFQSCVVELEELKQQALRAAGTDVAPEEEDMFCELAL